jgi:hypothetical protein
MMPPSIVRWGVRLQDQQWIASRHSMRRLEWQPAAVVKVGAGAGSGAGMDSPVLERVVEPGARRSAAARADFADQSNGL